MELERELNNKIYNLCSDILKKAWQDSDFSIDIGQIFFDECVKKLISAGKLLDLNENQFEADVCVYLGNIYSYLENWEKSYVYLVIQAKYNSWIHLFTVEKVVEKYKLYYRLKSAIEDRLENNNVKPENKKEFQDILRYLKSL